MHSQEDMLRSVIFGKVAGVNRSKPWTNRLAPYILVKIVAEC